MRGATSESGWVVVQRGACCCCAVHSKPFRVLGCSSVCTTMGAEAEIKRLDSGVRCTRPFQYALKSQLTYCSEPSADQGDDNSLRLLLSTSLPHSHWRVLSLLSSCGAEAAAGHSEIDECACVRACVCVFARTASKRRLEIACEARNFFHKLAKSCKTVSGF